MSAFVILVDAEPYLNGGRYALVPAAGLPLPAAEDVLLVQRVAQLGAPLGAPSEAGGGHDRSGGDGTALVDVAALRVETGTRISIRGPGVINLILAGKQEKGGA
jgi:hypothetical protein